VPTVGCVRYFFCAFVNALDWDLYFVFSSVAQTVYVGQSQDAETTNDDVTVVNDLSINFS